jgi:phosphatidylserine/phosphatidylglycerophosphate/cardiolipin synthase-like enzyme
MDSLGLISSLRDAFRSLPPQTWNAFVAAVSKEAGAISGVAAERVLAHVGNSEVRHELATQLNGIAPRTWSEVQLIAKTIEVSTPPRGRSLNLVWSGPDTNSMAARRIDQVLYDLLAQAKHRVFLITFSAYRVPRLVDALRATHSRGVKIMLLLETESDSDGQLSNDALNAFHGLPLNQIRVLHWQKSNAS